MQNNGIDLGARRPICAMLHNIASAKRIGRCALSMLFLDSLDDLPPRLTVCLLHTHWNYIHARSDDAFITRPRVKELPKNDVILSGFMPQGFKPRCLDHAGRGCASKRPYSRQCSRRQRKRSHVIGCGNWSEQEGWLRAAQDAAPEIPCIRRLERNAVLHMRLHSTRLAAGAVVQFDSRSRPRERRGSCRSLSRRLVAAREG